MSRRRRSSSKRPKTPSSIDETANRPRHNSGARAGADSGADSGTDSGTDSGQTGTGRALVLHPQLRTAAKGTRSPQARLDEAVGLALAIDLQVASAAVVVVTRPRPATLFGSGIAERIGLIVAEEMAELVVVDAALTPVQQRNLERAWDCKVIDRTGLILEIFGARARTKEGQLQVELAALTYQRSRLVRSWTHLERQRGGFGFLGGPGERQLEMDRRLITERIVRIKADLEQVKRRRELHRAARRRVPYPIVALVGYTNAGKSTLFNRLTKSDVAVKDQLFATLDPTMRRVRLPSGLQVIVSDTVGFISDLPTDLVAAFRATLEEVIEADLILHVRDIHHPDSDAQQQDVGLVLHALGLEDALNDSVIEVLNKIDLLDADSRTVIFKRTERNNRQVTCSAVTGEGVEGLLSHIDRAIAQSWQTVDLSVDLRDGASIAWLYDHGHVMDRQDDDACAHLRVHLDPADLARFHRRRSREDRKI